MSLRLSGIGSSRGIAIASARRVTAHAPEVVRRELPGAPEDEVRRFRGAMRRARARLRNTRDTLPSHFPGDVKAFIEAHLLILEDTGLTRPVVETIRVDACNAEWALKLHRDRLMESFDSIEDSYLRSRREDIDHVMLRLMRELLQEDRDHSDETRVGGPVLAVAEDLSPDELALLHRQGVTGLVLEKGGALSHTAIAARSLGIPAVMGVSGALRLLAEGETVMIDGGSGLLVAAPDQRTLTAFRRKAREQARRRRRRLRRESGRPETRDGQAVILEANIERAADFLGARRAGAEGVGLFRTEGLFVDRDEQPAEEEQFQVYRKLLRAARGEAVTVRTLDLWAHARAAGLDAVHGEPGQPALGLRAIRLCLQHPEIFRPQLRALLRASAHGRLRILLPMVSSLEEIRQTSALLRSLGKELDREGLSHDQDLQVGMMVEVPAAALSAHLFARHVDFLAIGTNDLIQYTLAIDRDDDAVQYLYDPLHPAFLRLIGMTVSASARAGIPVSLCGEIAGDPMFTRLLMGLGLRRLSMHPSSLAEVATAVTETDAGAAVRWVRRMMQSSDAAHSRRLLDRLNRGLDLS